jgi:hypothetical protein
VPALIAIDTARRMALDSVAMVPAAEGEVAGRRVTIEVLRS